jgi:hypothetical protein
MGIKLVEDKSYLSEFIYLGPLDTTSHSLEIRVFIFLSQYKEGTGPKHILMSCYL